MKKNFFKILGLGILVLPCMLVMTACSGKAIVNTSGNYAAITETNEIATTKTYLETKGSQDFESITGSRMKLTAKGKIDGQKMNMNMDAYCTLKDNMLNLKMSYKVMGINISVYADNNYMYMDMVGKKIKADTPADVTDIINSSTGTEGIMFSPSALLDSLKQIENNSLISNALIYSISKSEDATKIKIEMNQELMAQEGYTKYNVYFVFEKDVFQGMKVEAGMNDGKNSLNTTIEFAKYDGIIKMPSAKELEKYTYKPAI